MQQIKYIPVELLKNHPDNPRIIKDEAFWGLCDSLKDNPDYFETRPILCNPEMVVFAGNMRLRAAKEIGMKEVPVAIMDIPEKRQKELMVRDNKQAGQWDWDMLGAQFDTVDLFKFGFTPMDIGLEFSPAKQYEKCPHCGQEMKDPPLSPTTGDAIKSPPPDETAAQQ